MLESFPVVLFISIVLGFLAGLGVGGGSLLVLWLTLVVGMAHEEARIINLMFFLPAAVVSSLFRWKQGTLKPKHVLPAILSGCVAAAAFSFLSWQIDVTLLKKLFGGLLLFTGLREVLYRPRNAK